MNSEGDRVGITNYDICDFRSDSETKLPYHIQIRHTGASSGLIVVRNFDKEPNKKVHLLDDPPTKLVCRNRGILIYQKTCYLESFYNKFEGGSIDE